MKKSLFLAALIFCSGSLFSQSITQQLIGYSGEAASASGTYVSWTVGEPMISYLASGGYSVHQGFQQGHSLNATAIGSEDLLKSAIKIYPNPAFDVLKIEGQLTNSGGLEIQLMNSEGKTIMSKIRDDDSKLVLEAMDISDLPPGIYWISLKFDDGSEQTKKLIIQ